MPNFNRSASIMITPDSRIPFTIQGLRIVFSVKKTLTNFSNSARIDIYNLSKDSFAKIKLLNTLILNAGYTDGAGEKLLFTGDIQKIARERRGVDNVTRIQCGDGGTKLREVRGSLSYAAGTLAMTIVREILAAFRFPERAHVPFPVSSYVHGFSHTGTAKEALDKLTEKMGAEWSIQNGEMQLMLKGGTNLMPPVVITSENGLINSPESLDDMRGEYSLNKRDSGWRVKSLIKPNIEPGGKISLVSDTVSGSFRVEEVNHYGDTHEADWESISEVSGL